MKPPINVTLRQHQLEAYSQALQNRRFGLLHEMGTGKTLTAIATAGTLHQQGKVNRVLVVCPPQAALLTKQL
ncbi:MAG: DEAD/DEAH box helicase family protein [Oscillospiraceae bacterium]|nr:DEAD/DEAH box helicase family protein [Oscillospiraceae bacterium]